ncbi:hypothetical protein [Lentzea sp. NEAU-D7]|uniref:hypothetical protein n=1 Tax=Lentzea sp. NEAU-D7 TaxID=2994667 RepID=UPI00224AA690|nr:hypothetical protein [Lentzea sp. NEAU-D7]MCX2953165.1 hypothetical protein [Lentzea sp. NEAU-D7]
MRAEDVRAMVLEARDSPTGLTIHRTWIDGTLDLDFLTMAGPLTLVGCHLPEELTMRHAQLATVDLSSTTAWGVRAEGLRTRSFEMTDARCSDAFDLDHAQIDGTLSLNRTSIGSFSAYGLKVGGSFMASGLHAWPGWRGGCPLFLEDIDIGGDLALDEATVTGLDGPAIIANGARVGGVVFAKNAILRGDDDAFLLLEADIGGLHLGGAVLRGTLCTDGARIRSEVKLSGINAVSRQAGATIRMVDTKIGAGLVLSGLVRNRGGRAVSLHMTTVGASLTISEAEIDADTAAAALEISNCDIGSELTLRPDKLRNRGDGLELDLFSTKAGRALGLEPATLVDADASVTLNGLSYPDAPEDADAWLTMLREHTFRYEAQSYQQLAAVHRTAGHEHTARRVLIAQQEDLRRRGDPGNRLWHRFLGVTLGYGYKPSRAVAGLLATFLLALCLVWTTGAHNGLAPAKDRPADSCSPVNRISLAADLAIPLVKLGGTPRCELANGPAGQWATGAGWVVQVLGWSFATLSVAGFTGLVRKS